jgi:ABC-type branched-subunit amino acid transport system ATPase component/ABC-type branched-subunit amino acid transport system permease subunit
MTPISVPWRPALRLPSRKSLIIAVATVVALVAIKGLLLELGAHHIYTFATPLPAVVLGAIQGTTYGLLAVGLVLIYRTNRIINFAQGQMGAFGAALFGLIDVRYHVPYWVTLPIALAATGGVGALAETGVVRRLRNAPRLVSVVATLGVGQFLVFFAQAINSTSITGATYPQPSGLPSFHLGALLLTPAYCGMLVLSPLIVIALALFLRYSRFGLGLRSAAANPEAARMSGIFASRMSMLAWVIAGGLAAFTAILTQPTQGFATADTFGPELLLRSMTAAVIARMQSIPAALAAGVGVGILESLLFWNYPSGGLVEVTLFVVVLVALLVQRRRGGRDEEKGSWAAVQAMRPVPEALRQIWLVRNLGLVAGIPLLALTACLPLLLSNSLSVDATGILAFSIVGLSIGILTGLGGQLTLGQFAVAAVGAVVSYYVSLHTGDFVLALLYAGLGAGVVSVLIGLPALRIRGLMLTVTTLSFALATPAWLLAQPWAFGSGVSPRSPTLDGIPLDTGHSYYYFAFVVFLIAVILARNVRRSGFGRLLVAVRDNEDNARAFTVRANLVKLQGYLLAGFLAGLGGAVYAHSLSAVDLNTFPVDFSLDVVVMTVIGGVSLLVGPIIGALYVLGIPDVFSGMGNVGLAATQFGALLLVLFLPRGLGSLLGLARDRIVRRIGRRYGLDLEAEEPAARLPQRLPSVAVVPRAKPGSPPGSTLLQAAHLSKRFGGVRAVNDVSLSVRTGQTVGLIGPNGAGKTTLFELLGGFTKSDSGRVLFDHQDVTDLGPEQRASLGLIRSFQDALLFPTMTVLEAVELGLERVAPTRFLSAVVGHGRSERRRELRAREIVAAMGLDSYRDKSIQELSTGTRRITEIACLVALEPTLLLLDEPSSGIAQRETEALGHLLTALKAELGLTLVVIEHDIPLIMGIADHIVAMADGRVISAGEPAEVRADPLVVEAYLGGRLDAIERSDAGQPRRRPLIPTGV